MHRKLVERKKVCVYLMLWLLIAGECQVERFPLNGAPRPLGTTACRSS